MSLQRLRNDLQFAVIVLFCAAGLLGVLPFLVYRLLQGEVDAALLDTAIVAALAGVGLYAWRGGDLERASLLLVAFSTLGTALVVHVLGMAGVLWSYPAIASFFLLLRRGRALVAASIVVLLLVLDGQAFDSLLHRLMYLSSALVTSVIAYVFARRTQLQRERLEVLVARDPLTGVANRRAMAKELRIASEAFQRHRVPTGLLVMDIDHFKRINDTLGHEAGDDTLVAFARLVQSHCRVGDRLFRLGGEEFVLLLAGTGIDDLRAYAESLRAAVAAGLRAGGRAVTVSIGGAVLRAGEDNAHWLARADAAMYEAKRAGRDRTVIAIEQAVDPGTAMPP
ncbi:MAG TPA: GGDEF domain-containing protein [Lysobacter sp.]|nr:GGDEF domain-containing protein [Lysobacter sp.]